MLDYVDLSIPYTKELDKIWNIGSSYIIHADIPASENATFYINFLHDAPEWHHYRQLGEKIYV
jgi:spermidine/putrescine-binding protein